MCERRQESHSLLRSRSAAQPWTSCFTLSQVFYFLFRHKPLRKLFFQKCLYQTQLGLKLICHYWNINRNKGPECPGAETFPAQRALTEAALYWAGDPEVFNHEPWSEFHTSYSALHPTKATLWKISLMENSKILEYKRGLHEVIVYELCETKVRQLTLTETSLLGIPS